MEPGDKRPPNISPGEPTGEISKRLGARIPHLEEVSQQAGQTAVHYRQVPQRLVQQGLPPSTICWRVELHNLGPDAEPMGLDIVGDTIIGRGNTADVDLDAYSVFFSGVSRQHIMLRPSPQRLYVLDMGSTNGTMINGVPLPRSQARILESGDIITIGKFSIRLVIIDRHLLNGASLRLTDEATGEEVSEAPYQGSGDHTTITVQLIPPPDDEEDSPGEA